MSAQEGKTSFVCLYWVWSRLLLSLHISVTQKQKLVERTSPGLSRIPPLQQLVWSALVLTFVPPPIFHFLWAFPNETGDSILFYPKRTFIYLLFIYCGAKVYL